MSICYNCFKEHDGAFCPYCGYSVSQDKGKFPVALPKGTILAGRYIVGRVLGQGGFGITYVAQNYHTKEIFAIKEYFPETMATRIESRTVSSYTDERSESFMYGKSCFLNEAKTLAEFIGNPNIVRVYSYFEENNTAYFVMEYITGISLLKYLKNNGGKISVAEAKNILFPIMGALSHVHSKGIIHRDISPDNIYITSDGNVKLLDFGSARYSLGDKSRSLDVVLKHGYAPKEQYTRRGRQGPYTDVYALAATFYRTVTGKVPPDSVERMDEDDLIYPSNLGVNISSQDEDALIKALSVYPVDRFQNMNDFRNAMGSQAVMPVQQNYSQPPAPAAQNYSQATVPVVHDFNQRVAPAAPSYNQAAAPQNNQNNLNYQNQIQQEQAKQAQLEKARQEQARLEQEKLEKQRIERERKEQERLEREKKKREEQERLKQLKEEKAKKKQNEKALKKQEKENSATAKSNGKKESDKNKKGINLKVLLFTIIPVAVILIAIGVTVAIVTSGDSGSSGPSDDNFSYVVVNDNEASITGYTGTDKDVEIPDSVDGRTVTEIGTNAFYQSDITSVKIPSGVKTIDKWAFYGCKSLTEVSVPDTVSEIEYYAFLSCDSLKNITLPENCNYEENSFDSSLVISKN